jgi:hypothetical protein
LIAAFLGGAAQATPVKVLVKRGGLQFTGPCKVKLLPEGESAAQPGEEAVAGATVDVEPGRYLGIVSCPSTEGELKKSVGLKVRRTDKLLKARVKLRPAFIVPHLLRDGKEIDGHIQVFDRRGVEVAAGPPRDVLVVPAERLHLVAEKKSSPEERGLHVPKAVREITLSPGQKKTPKLDVSDAHLTVSLFENGARAKGLVILRLPGTRQEIATFAANKKAAVPPGSFDVVTQVEGSHDFHEEKKRKVKLKPRQRLALSLRHRTGRIKPVFNLQGTGVDKGAVEVDLYLGAAPAPFATLQPGETGKVKPGSYRVVGRVRDQTFDDGAPWSGEKKVVVSAGQTQKVSLDLRPAHLDVYTRLFDKAGPVQVQIFAPNQKAPVFEGASNKKGRLDLKLAPGPVEIVASATRGGPELRSAPEKRVLQRGQSHEVFLKVLAGQAVVQVFDAEGFAVTAEVTLRLMERRGDAGITFNAGEEVALAPGVYALTVSYQGKMHEFGKLKVTPSRTAERQVVLPAGSP